MWPAGKKTMVNQHNFKNILKRRLKYFHIWEIEKHFWKQAKILVWEKNHWALPMRTVPASTYWLLIFHQKKICTFKLNFFIPQIPRTGFEISSDVLLTGRKFLAHFRFDPIHQLWKSIFLGEQHMETLSHNPTSWKSPVSQKCKFTATPPISKAKPFVWIEHVWIQLVVLM